MSPQTIIFIGRSGCGKGTQADLFQKYLEQTDPNKRPVYYLETGANFRKFIEGATYTSRLSKETYDQNRLQPAFLAIWTWADLLIRNITGEEHILIDGTPRTLPEAMTLDTALSFYGRRANVVYLKVSRETSKKHLVSRGRFDDADTVMIDRRLDWFDTTVLPAIEYLHGSAHHNFIEIDGEKSIAEVHEEIKMKIKIF